MTQQGEPIGIGVVPPVQDPREDAKIDKACPLAAAQQGAPFIEKPAS